MSAYRGLHHIFDNNPLPENLSSFIDSLSKIKPPNPIDQHSFTEIFGELHFKENPHNNNTTSQCRDEDNKWSNISKFSPYHKRTESSSSMNSESLQLCTEGLGFESLDNLEDLNMDFQSSIREKVCKRSSGYSKKEEHSKKGKGKGKEGGFPPPIPSIGGNHVGKPWVCFESHRVDGRFILKEIRIPTQECLHASREDGRLRLCFVQESKEDAAAAAAEEEQEEEEEEEEDDDDDEQEEEEREEQEDSEQEPKNRDDFEE